MELLPEGKNFRLVEKEELPEILNVLEEYLLDSLKVSKKINKFPKTINYDLDL